MLKINLSNFNQSFLIYIFFLSNIIKTLNKKNNFFYTYLIWYKFNKFSNFNKFFLCKFTFNFKTYCYKNINFSYFLTYSLKLKFSKKKNIKIIHFLTGSKSFFFYFLIKQFNLQQMILTNWLNWYFFTKNIFLFQKNIKNKKNIFYLNNKLL